MDINKVLEGLDQLVEDSKNEEVIPYLTHALKSAEDEADYGSMLSILNEMMGFCREICDYEASLGYGREAVKLIGETSMTGSVAHATTLLNVANALRAAGHLEDSLSTYQQVEEMYKELLSENDFNYASLYNNESLLYQEMEEYGKAIDCLNKALDIVLLHSDKEWELAVTYTNLANSMLAVAYTDKEEDYINNQGINSDDFHQNAETYAKKAVNIFEKLHVVDTHYAAAIMAMGQIYEKKKDYNQALMCYEKGMTVIQSTLGETDYYYRMKEYLNNVMEKLDTIDKAFSTMADEHLTIGNVKEYGGVSSKKGMDLCREYYKESGLPMLTEKYEEYLDDIAVGLVGEGSDCFGWDDKWSRDHDFGPGFIIWLDDDLYDEIGEELKEDYDRLPNEYKGFKRTITKQAKERMGVQRISEFYQRYLGRGAFLEWMEEGDISRDKLLAIPEERLAAVINGEVWLDIRWEFSELREFLEGYFDDCAITIKLAEAFAKFSQGLQYNYARMKKRSDLVAASLSVFSGLKQALRIGYLLNRTYAPHDKWLWEGARDFKVCPKLAAMVERIVEDFNIHQEDGDKVFEQEVEKLASYLLEETVEQGYIGNVQLISVNGQLYADSYLDHYTEELLLRSEYTDKGHGQLVDEIVNMEWEAFDKVINEGGRASCQDDFHTFKIMRSSQYNTWNQDMLIQYATDFRLSLNRGWNMIMEKYGRMEESTAPEKWAEISKNFPVIPPEKQAIIEEVVKIQVKWMEEFAHKFPVLAKQARSIHTSEDLPEDTSYETYLRGELATYSDKMLKLYGGFVVSLFKMNRNLAYETMEQTVRMYGYESVEDATMRMK